MLYSFLFTVRKRIQIAIEVVKEASRAILDIKSVVFFPFGDNFPHLLTRQSHKTSGFSVVSHKYGKLFCMTLSCGVKIVHFQSCFAFSRKFQRSFIGNCCVSEGVYCAVHVYFGRITPIAQIGIHVRGVSERV
jgi:hypothetical protein